MSITKKNLVLTVSSGVLLTLAWPPLPFTFLIFIAIVPLLLVEQSCRENKVAFGMYLLYTYLGLLIWNILTTFWIYNTSIRAATIVNVVNPLIQLIPFVFYHLFRRKHTDLIAGMMLVVSWVSVEYFHHTWQFAFPFLTLGNALAKYPWLIQTYEVTGVFGGTVWVLLLNILVFRVLNDLRRNKRVNVAAYYCILALLLPLLTSLLLYFRYEDKGKPVKVAVLHSNIDCRNTKYKVQPELLVEKYISISNSIDLNDVDYLVWPETAITNAQWVSSLPKSDLVKDLRSRLLLKAPTKLISGAILYEQYLGDKTSIPANVGYSEAHDLMFYNYNAAFQVDRNPASSIPIRTKSKLVPIEETVPYGDQLSFLRTIIGSLGGFYFSTRKWNTDIFQSKDGVGVAPIICYESVFGSLVADYVGDGANLIFVLLNEGWYKSNYGASQFMYLSSIRAVENRRSIARASNDGISCFIDQRGVIHQEVGQYAPKVISQVIYANRTKTIYTVFGDAIAVVCVVLSMILLMWFLLKK